MAVDDHAIIVGVQCYPGISPLEGPCQDAEDIFNWLSDPAKGDVPPANIKKMLTTDFHPPDPQQVSDAKPNQNDLENLFRPYVTAGASNRLGRRLYIFVAGHGFSDPTNMSETALYTADAEFNFGLQLAATGYANWFRRNAVFDELVLVMDCCRTTTPLQSVGPVVPAPNTSQPSRASQVKTFYAFATGWGQVARERQINGVVRGVFTTAFLEALENAKPNRLGNVTGEILNNFVHNYIHLNYGDIDPPEIYLDHNKDIIFFTRGVINTNTVTITLDPYVGGETIEVLDGSLKAIQNITAEAAATEISLENGIYKIQVRGTSRAKLKEIVQDETITI